METPLLQDLAVVMVVAAAVTALCRLLRQPVVLGYLVAGLLIGPHTPPFTFVHDLGSIRTMADLGLVFLMFALGLEFSLPRLARVGLPAAGAGILEMGILLLAGIGLGRLLGWSRPDRVFLGAMLSISSTTIIVKILTDMKREREGFAQLVFGLLIVEDVAAVLLLSLLPALGAGTATSGAAAAGAVRVILRIGFFAVFFLVAGLSLVPRLLAMIGRFRSREALGITAMGLCLAGAVAAARAGFSVALGAFLAGAVIAASSEAERVEEWFHPVRDMFSALFFVSVGLLIDPAALWTHKAIIFAAAGAVVVGKALAVGGGILLAGYDLKTALRAGLSMGQIGEFSFVIAGLGAASGLTSGFLFPVAVGVSTVTTLLAPPLIRRSDELAAAFERLAPSVLVRALQNYHGWSHARKMAGSRAETLIFSKYVVRLILYIVLFVATVLLARGVSLAARMGMGFSPAIEDGIQALVWLSASVIAFPLAVAVSKYANHMALLVATLASPTWLLARINIRRMYAAADTVVIGILGLFLADIASGAFSKYGSLIATIVAAILGAYIFRAWVIRVRERVERLLDEVLGLATSEPTRQAVLRSGERTLVLQDITEESVVTPDSVAIGRTLSELRLRELSGASVVALYRHGRHTANPGSDTRLEAGDVVVLLGETDQRRRAAELLKDSAPPKELQ